MVQANCRTRFTAADFDFIVRALSSSRRESVSLVSLLTDADTRDALLDQPRSPTPSCRKVTIWLFSPQFYFYVLTRSVLRRAGIDDRPLCDYLASLLDEFTRTAALRNPMSAAGGVGARVYLPICSSRSNRPTRRRRFSCGRGWATTRFS